MTSEPGSTGADAGREAARAVVEQISAALGPRLISAYAIGSLAHGGFSAAVSDVDVAVLVDRCGHDIKGIVEAAVTRTQVDRGPGLADRLSVFYGDWQTFRDPLPAARLGAIDRLDLMQHGELLHGSDRRAVDGVVPSREELVAETARFLAVSPVEPPRAAELVAAGPRALTKAVLSPVRFMYTHATGRAGPNEDAVAWYREQRRPHVELVDAALTWRHHLVSPGLAIPLLEQHLRALHDECRRTFMPA